MKKILLLIALFTHICVSAQKIYKIKYNIENMSVNGETIQIQRSTPQEIAKYYSTDYAVAMDLMKLQEQLNNARKWAQEHEEISFLHIIDELQADIKKNDAGFNMSIYDGEIALYHKYQYPNKVSYSTADDKLLNKEVNAPTLLLLDSSLDQMPRFNEMILKYVRNFTFVKTDTLMANYEGAKEIRYYYASPQKDTLQIHYEVKLKGASADFKTNGYFRITKHYLVGQFLTMTDVYNGIFGKTLSPQEAHSVQQVGNGYYHGVQFTYMFSPIRDMPGYWDLTIWNR